MKIDLNRDEMILILFCLKYFDFGEDDLEAINVRRQLIAKIFFALSPANPPDWPFFFLTMHYTLTNKQHRILVTALADHECRSRMYPRPGTSEMEGEEYRDEIWRLIHLFEVKRGFNVVINVKGGTVNQWITRSLNS